MNEVFKMFREILLKVVESVVGYKVVRYRNKKGSAWWTKEIRNAMEEKKKAFGILFNRNLPVEVQQRREGYKICKWNVKKLI